MPDIDLKEYTRRAKELETAIYTQKRLMDKHRTIVEDTRPSTPVNPQTSMKAPVKPNYSYYVAKQQYKEEDKIYALAGLIGGVVLLGPAPVLGVLSLILGGVMGISILTLKKTQKKHNKR